MAVSPFKSKKKKSNKPSFSTCFSDQPNRYIVFAILTHSMTSYMSGNGGFPSSPILSLMNFSRYRTGPSCRPCTTFNLTLCRFTESVPDSLHSSLYKDITLALNLNCNAKLLKYLIIIKYGCYSTLLITLIL